MAAPWDRWIPGVLSRRQVKVLRTAGFLENFSDEDSAFDHSSVDLHLTHEAYELPRGSVKPSGARYFNGLRTQTLTKPLAPTDGCFQLEARRTYLFKLKERIGSTSELAQGDFHGQATAKSSIGRLDVLARLIVDGANIYEGFAAESLGGSTGELFLEITPMTFAIVVREGNSLNQLRFFRGSPETAEIGGGTIAKAVLTNATGSGHMLSADLSNVEVVPGEHAAAFRSRKREHIPGPIDLSVKVGKGSPPNPKEYWELVRADANKRLQIERGESFYIIRSLERMEVPQGVAVYCRAIDETIGEIRIHYAGFVHPFFGQDRKDGKTGTPLIFEVRGHDVNVNLGHGEKMARLVFYRMSEDAERPTEPTAYTNQELQLSTYFAPWSNSVAAS